MNVLTEIRERREDSYKILDDASSIADTDILQKHDSRKKTDRVFLTIFAASIVLLLPFLIYTLCHSDMNRLKGYDSCGNICGQKNVKDDRWNCTGQDMTLKPTLKSYPRECHKAEDNDFSIHTTFRLENIFAFFHRAVWKFTLVSFVPLSLCLILVVLFRYVPTVAVWSILIVSWMVFTATGLLFLLIHEYWLKEFVVLFCTISLLLLCSFILFNLRKIRLTTVLLKEAARAVFEVKMMSYVPIGALSLSVIILMTYTYISFHTMTSGKLIERYSGKLDYVNDGWMTATETLNTIITIWVILFVLGIHDMIVGGVVARWYATKNNDNMYDAMPSSLRVTTRYHMGTVALGCVMMVTMYIPRLIIQFLSQFSAMKEKSVVYLNYLDGFFTNNAYIITAMYGTSYFQSGKKAMTLLRLSIGDTIELNSFGNFVIMLAQTLVVFVSTLGAYVTLYYMIGVYGIYSEYFSLIEFGIACICAHTILGTLKVSSNTLFFCTTEELLRNKEAGLPYTLTMAEFLDSSNKLFLLKVQNKPPSNVSVKRCYILLFLFIFVSLSCVLYFVGYFI